MSPLPKSRIGERVEFKAPKGAPGPSILGTVRDQVWTGPHIDPAWGEYAFFSELIEWDGGGESVRLSYYYKSATKADWIFGGQYSIEGSPSEIKELLQKTLEKADWFK